MLEIERAMLNILCEAKEGIPAIITIKNAETGEIKKGQITLKVKLLLMVIKQIYQNPFLHKFMINLNVRQINRQKLLDNSHNKMLLLKIIKKNR